MEVLSGLSGFLIGVGVGVPIGGILAWLYASKVIAELKRAAGRLP